MLRRLTILICLLGLAPAWATAETEFYVGADTRAGLPFSDAVIVNGLMIMSGQLGVDPASFTLVPGGIEAQTRKIFSNMKTMLMAHGADFSDIVKCTVMIADIAEWPAFNAIYLEYFPGPKPARSALGANGLALDAAVELECWAAVDPA